MLLLIGAYSILCSFVPTQSVPSQTIFVKHRVTRQFEMTVPTRTSLKLIWSPEVVEVKFIFKAGCTSWIFWQTSMHYPGTMKHSMNMATASVVKIGPELGNQILIGKDATRFLVVRHPLLRFYSGFRQKFKARIKKVTLPV